MNELEKMLRENENIAIGFEHYNRINDQHAMAEINRLVTLAHCNPNAFMKLVDIAEIILSVRDGFWKETESSC
ncbi:MAG: hypothetical protein JNN15_10360 [Blastocatellia bacterium]|nr:hypothetical protein [Blastocatellia bacterium]